MNKIMLLGDSIRQGYQQATADLFKDTAEVWGPEENCRFSAYIITELDNYLAKCPDPDLIMWNSGLWDVTHYHNADSCLIPLDRYVHYHIKIAERLSRVGAKMVFALTTPVNDEKCRSTSNAAIAEYNEAVKQALLDCPYDVEIFDLFSVVNADKDAYICEDGIHLTEAGVAAVAKANYDYIKPLLTRKDILLLGDSIRLGYQGWVKEAMGKEARITVHPDNCRFTEYMFNVLWYTQGELRKPDIIHFNCGIWDMEQFYGEKDNFIPVDDYAENLKRIVNAFHYLWGDHLTLIFATSTPRNLPGNLELTQKYNAAAIEALTPLGVHIDDLYPVIADHMEYICPDKTHHTIEGQKACAEVVTACLRKYL